MLTSMKNKRKSNTKKILFLFSLAIIIVIGYLFYSQRKLKEITHYSEKISVSPDDQRILFSLYKGNTASIYEADINTKNVKRLTNPKNEYHLCPAYSPDGSRILFISYSNDSKNPISYLYIMDLDSKNVEQITFEKQHIIEAIFSPDNTNIYFITSGFYGHYSPVVGSRPQELDIFSINLANESIERVTNLSAYEMDGISINPAGDMLVFDSYGSEHGGDSICFLPLDNQEELNYLKPLEIVGDLQLSPNGKLLVFLGLSGKTCQGNYTYDIILMDIGTRKLKQLTKLGKYTEFHSFRFLHNQHRILFVNGWGKSPPNLLQMNLDGSCIKKPFRLDELMNIANHALVK